MALRSSTLAQFWWVRWVPAVLMLIACGLVAIRIGRNVIVPLALSFAVAFMLAPLVDWFEGRKLARNGAVLMSLATALVGMAVLVLFLLPGVWTQFGESFAKLPLALRALVQRGTLFVGWLQEHLSPELFSRLGEELERFQSDPSALTSHFGGWLSTGMFGLVGAGSAALGLVVVPFFVYYLLLDMHQLRDLVESHIPARHRPAGCRLLDEIGVVVLGYVRGRLLLAAIMAAIYAVGLFVLQVPLWAAISVIAGIFGIIPYLGVLSGFVLAMGFATLSGATSWRLIGIAAVFGAAQIIDDYVLTPRIIGNRLELHPMVILIAVIIGGDLMGLLGMLFAIPVLAVLKVLLRFLDGLYMQTEFFSRERERGVEIPSPPTSGRDAPSVRTGMTNGR